MGFFPQDKGNTIDSMNTTLECSPVDRLLDPLARCLTAEVARSIVDFHADAATQARIDELADKCNEGQLTALERAEYEAYVEAIDFIAILQAKAWSILNQGVSAL